MNKIFFSILSLCFVFTASIKAQKTLDKGYIKMEITDVSSADEQMAAMLEMMKGTQTEIFFADGNHMSKMDMMGGMVKMQTLFQKEGESIDMLFDMMGQKMHIATTTKEMEAKNGDQKDAMEGMEIVYDEEDTKEILGYKCVKAKVMDPKTKKAMVEMYISREIKADSKMLQGMQHFDLEGYPLELIMNQPQMSLTLATVELKEEVDTSVFKLNTDGFTKMTFDEFSEKMGAMGGGGFGF